MEYRKIPKQDLLTKIYNSIQNHNFNKALMRIEKYLSISHNGVYDMLLNMYIDCQIKLGLLDEAAKNLDLMVKHFPNFYKDKNYELALRYASCCRDNKVREILSNIKFKDEELYMIGKFCFDNTCFDLAYELFDMCSNSTSKKVSENAKRNLRLLSIYKSNGSNVFHSQTYGCFKYHGNVLEPGHVVISCLIRDEYKENTGYSDLKSIERPYMIWKIEGSKIYAFPLTTRLDKYRYVISSDNYPSRDVDRCIKDRLVCLKEHDITTVIDKITDKDYIKSIDSVYASICNTQKGYWTEDIKDFMNTLLPTREVNVGDIIIVNTSCGMRYYFVLDVDTLDDGYKVLEVDKHYSRIYDNASISVIDDNQFIVGIFSLLDCYKKEKLFLKAKESLDNLRGEIVVRKLLK